MVVQNICVGLAESDKKRKSMLLRTVKLFVVIKMYIIELVPLMLSNIKFGSQLFAFIINFNLPP